MVSAARGACWSEANESQTTLDSISSLFYTSAVTTTTASASPWNVSFYWGIMSIFPFLLLSSSSPNICAILPSDSFARLTSEAETQGGEGGRWGVREPVAFQLMIHLRRGLWVMRLSWDKLASAMPAWRCRGAKMNKHNQRFMWQEAQASVPTHCTSPSSAFHWWQLLTDLILQRFS